MSDNHHQQSFWTKYIWSTDRKVIGIQYAITSLVWLLIGFGLMAIMRYQLACPGTPVPLTGNFLGEVEYYLLKCTISWCDAWHHCTIF